MESCVTSISSDDSSSVDSINFNKHNESDFSEDSKHDDEFDENGSTLIKDEIINIDQTISDESSKKEFNESDDSLSEDESDTSDKFQICTESLPGPDDVSLSNFSDSDSTPKEQYASEKLSTYKIIIKKLKSQICDIHTESSTLKTQVGKNRLKMENIEIQLKKLSNIRHSIKQEVQLQESQFKKVMSLKKEKEILLRLYNRKLEIESRRLEELEKHNRLSKQVDSFHTICDNWIMEVCKDKNCIYQHPIIKSSLPKKMSKELSNKNPRNFTRNSQQQQQQQRGSGKNKTTYLLCRMFCEPCSLHLQLQDSHIVNDLFCKECCETLMSFNRPSDILSELITIWHHMYKRCQMKNINFQQEQQQPQQKEEILECWDKCCRAIDAKITSIVLLHGIAEITKEEVYFNAAKHVIFTYMKRRNYGQLDEFLRRLEYYPELVLFATELVYPINCLFRILTTSINFHITNNSNNNMTDVAAVGGGGSGGGSGLLPLLQKLATIANCLNEDLYSQMIQWITVAMANKKGFHSNHNHNYHYHKHQKNHYVSEMVDITLRNLLTDNYWTLNTITTTGLELGCSYWCEKSEKFDRLSSVCDCLDDMINCLLKKVRSVFVHCLAIIKYYKGCKMDSLRLCDRYKTNDFVFQILADRIKLTMVDCVDLVLVVKENLCAYIEFCFNKAEWLLQNGSVLECSDWLINEVFRVVYDFDRVDVNVTNNKYWYTKMMMIFPIKKIYQKKTDLLRQSSSLWMCYILLLSITDNLNGAMITEQKQDDFLLTNRNFLMQLEAHYCRSVCYLISKLSSSSSSPRFDVKVVLKLKERINFFNFVALIRAVKWEIYSEEELIDFCTFLIDYSHTNFGITETRVVYAELAKQICDVNKMDSKITKEVIQFLAISFPVDEPIFWLVYLEFLENGNGNGNDESNDSSRSSLFELVDVAKIGLKKAGLSCKLWRRLQSYADRICSSDLLKFVHEGTWERGIDL